MHVGGLGDDPKLEPHRSAAIFDEAREDDGWRTGPAMNTGRSHQNTVLLPDGGMVAVGGGYGDRKPLGQWMAGPEHRAVELYDPATGSWRLGAAQQEGRAYHSTALLLPDGRVLSAGDDINGSPNGDTAEIYEPPYLHRGPRPTITSAPEGLMWGDDFHVGTPDAVTRAVLMAPGAVTHANDMSQRHVELDVIGRAPGQGVDLRAPVGANAAPPGYYMLFVLENGIPSVARWVRLGVPTSPPGGTPPPPPGGTPPPLPPAHHDHPAVAARRHHHAVPARGHHVAGPRPRGHPRRAPASQAPRPSPADRTPQPAGGGHGQPRGDRPHHGPPRQPHRPPRRPA